MEIICIAHSGFLVGLTGYNFIFDYFTDKKNIITPEIFKTKKTCVFVSHSHFDHYNTKIFDWSAYGELTYILDSGCKIPAGVKSDREKIIFVREGESVDLYGGAVKINTYGSTDEGVSFLAEAENRVIFHAGDLNDWYWEDESTQEELAEYEMNYINIIKKLAGKNIDLAFVPEDPRLGRNAGRGIAHFKKIVAPERIIAMHYPGNDGKIMV